MDLRIIASNHRESNYNHFNKRKTHDASVMNKTDFLKTGTGILRLIFFPMKEPAKRMGKNKAEISKVRIVNKPQKPYPAKAIT
ncbi:MAG: hypothetical protein GX103_00765, partial [Bacteroidales bacterium]|nr:hypothetical protein [Bacteroidales bacterium]